MYKNWVCECGASAYCSEMHFGWPNKQTKTNKYTKKWINEQANKQTNKQTSIQINVLHSSKNLKTNDRAEEAIFWPFVFFIFLPQLIQWGREEGRVTVLVRFLRIWLCSHHAGNHILTSGMTHAGYVSVASIYGKPCEHRLGLGFSLFRGNQVLPPLHSFRDQVADTSGRYVMFHWLIG